VLFALLGGLFGCGALVLVLVVMVLALAKSQADTTAREIQAGYVSGLLDFHPGLLAELSTTLVGSFHYYRPMGGARTLKLAGKVPSWRFTGDVLAISAELTPRRREGHVAITTNAVRVDLTQAGDYWHASMNGSALGAIHLPSGRVFDPFRNELGYCLRPAGSPGPFVLRGVELAWVAPGAHFAENPVANLHPLLRLGVPQPNPEACGWLLAIIGLELGVHAMPSGGSVVAGVP